jgi:hypothetical protein
MVVLYVFSALMMVIFWASGLLRDGGAKKMMSCKGKSKANEWCHRCAYHPGLDCEHCDPKPYEE